MRAWLLTVLGLSAGCDSAFRQFTVDTAFGPGGTADSGLSDNWYCDKRYSDGRCIQYVGDGWDDAGRASDCAGAAIAGVCPASDLGGCTRGPATPLARTEWYFTGDYYSEADLESLEASCLQDYGLWIAGG